MKHIVAQSNEIIMEPAWPMTAADHEENAREQEQIPKNPPDGARFLHRYRNRRDRRLVSCHRRVEERGHVSQAGARKADPGSPTQAVRPGQSDPCVGSNKRRVERETKNVPVRNKS